MNKLSASLFVFFTKSLSKHLPHKQPTDFKCLISHTSNNSADETKSNFSPEYQLMVDLYNKDKFGPELENSPSLEAASGSEPILPGAEECCGEGCQNCVWLEYVVKVRFHSNGNEEEIKKAINRISNSDVKAFVSFELQKMMK